MALHPKTSVDKTPLLFKRSGQCPFLFLGKIITSTEPYRQEGITWWDYCGMQLVNSYPTYFAKLPALIDKINAEKKNSK